MMEFQDLKTKFIGQVDAKPAIKYIFLIQLCGLCLASLNPILDLFVLVPSNLFQLHLWRVVTNLFLENNLIVIAWTVYSFLQFLTYIHPNWPLEESVKYIIVIQLTSNFSLVISALLLYIFTGIVYPFYTARIYGTSALAMAALIALKQYLPDTVLLTTPFGRLKNGHLPMCSVIIAIFLWPFGLFRGTIPFQLMFSLQISWTYLRFFQSRGGIGESMVGDRSEHFSWASLFPRRIQPIATLAGRLTFRSLHRLGILKRVIRREHLDLMEEQTLQMEALESVKVENAGTAVLAPESWDAERKRQKALRMLNERLAAQHQKMNPSNEKSGGHFGSTETTNEPYTFPHQDQFLRTAINGKEDEIGGGDFGSSGGSTEVQFYLDQRSSSEREQSQPKQSDDGQ